MNSTVADYVGRTIDLLAYQGAQAAGDTLLTPSLATAGEGGRIINQELP